MKEYTILAVLGVAAALLLDHFLKTRLVRQKRFWLFWGVMGVLISIANGYLTWRPIVIYGEPFYLGIRIGTIPAEDYLFGFGLITMNIVLWEFFTRRFNIPESPNDRNETHHE
jgi:lycopene cyclase domain-containing protein